jgi:serine/threonine protein kinase
MSSAALVLEAGANPRPGYHLERFRGRGGYGEVWEARTPQGTRVALKFLPCGLSDRASREIRSIQAVRQLHHPNLVRIHNVWCCPGYVVVAMELADGSLLDLLQAFRQEYGTPVPAGDLLPLLAQAAAALDYLNTRRHQLGGLLLAARHGDIKPANLLLFGDIVKLSDFGLTSLSSATTGAQVPAGTFGYMAPEVARGWVSDRSDQYALAATYCQLRGGRLPFDQATDTASGEGPRLDLTMLPDSEQPIIARALAAATWQRWPSCAEFVAQLQRVIRDEVRQRSKSLSPGTPAQRPPPEQGERRVATRYSCGLGVSLRRLGSLERRAWPGRVQDVSCTGIGLLTETAFDRGAVLVTDLHGAAASAAGPRLVRVARTARQFHGGVVLGCLFARPLAEDEIRALLALGQPGAPADTELADTLLSG